MSTIEVNKITPVSGGTTVQVGESGDTINIPAGATIANAGTATGFGVSLANGADNRVITASSASALNGESTLTFNGTTLQNNQAQNTDATIHASSYTTGVKLIADSQNSLSKVDASGDLAFISSSSEKMRLLTNDVLCIGATSRSGSPNTSCLELKGTEAPLSIINETASDSGDRTSISLRNSSGTLVGNVGVDNSNAMFNTSSDYRLKENEVAISDGITRLKQLKPYKFNFKIQADKTVDGFFAHEVSPVVPEAITGTKDATETYTDDNGDEQTRIKPQAIDQSKLVPLLTSALQEAITKIETLEAKVAALESA
jgi:hypothetical protein